MVIDIVQSILSEATVDMIINLRDLIKVVDDNGRSLGLGNLGKGRHGLLTM